MKTFSYIVFAFWLNAVMMGHLLDLHPDMIHLSAVLQWPGSEHWLGTDDLGRDILARVLQGVEISFAVAVVVTGVTMFTGITLGLLAGYAGGKMDTMLTTVVNIFMAFPGMLLAIAFAAVLGPGINNLILALCLTGWVTYARLSRGQTLTLKNRIHVLAAQSLGANAFRVMFRHILPLMFSLLMVEATYSMAGVMVAEASLSFLGLGIQAPQASWGGMLRDGVRYMLVAPHYVLGVGFCMMSLILAVNLAGDVMRDKLDVLSEPHS